jgi:hypothetical protein
MESFLTYRRIGTPQSALVGIATTAGLKIVFDTVKTSRKYPSLIRAARVFRRALSNGEQTVQLEGTAFEPQGSALEHYRQMYFAVWPDGRDRLAWPGIVHLVVQPQWIRAVDYDQSPPLLEEIHFPNRKRSGGRHNTSAP